MRTGAPRVRSPRIDFTNIIRGVTYTDAARSYTNIKDGVHYHLVTLDGTQDPNAGGGFDFWGSLSGIFGSI